MNTNYFNQVRSEIAEFFPASVETVIEIGCGEGSTLAWLKSQNRAKYTIGIETSSDAAAKASNVVDEIYVADISIDEEVIEANRMRADVVLLLDVLEHLREPQKALTKIQQLVKPDGIIIASIPNIRSIKVLLPLVLFGKFEYTDSGILDRTHVVFFTKKSIIKLFHGCGLLNLKIKPNGALNYRDAKTPAGILTSTFNILTFGLFTEFLANQWLVQASIKRDN
jgi:2-polyprenyl-3-methyl-5-hydroxy-6-metoxy-1,4-benzoquinol methylase